MGASRDDMSLRGITVDRLGDRKTLLRNFDEMRRDIDGSKRGIDPLTDQALDLLTSTKLADALDLSKEDVRTVDRYGERWRRCGVVQFRRRMSPPRCSCGHRFEKPGP